MATASSIPHGAYRPRQPECSVLYEVIDEQLEGFLAAAASRGHPLPLFIERTFRNYLACGIAAHGFVRVHCDQCGDDRVVAFSCKRRGVCPSCAGRRMADTAADLVDHVLPRVGVRQWVLSLPFSLRYRLAYDRKLLSPVLGAFVRAVFRWQQRQIRARYGVAQAKCGAVTFVQRFGGALNLNVHFHCLVLEGGYEVPPQTGAVGFLRLPAPSDDDVMEVLADAAGRIHRQLVKHGFGANAGDSGEDAPQDPLAKSNPLLADLYAASLLARGSKGRDAPGQTRRSTGGTRAAARPVPLCAVGYGLSLHAGVFVPASDRHRLERIVRYTARPQLATERLSRLPDGRLRYDLRQPWRDGTTHVLLEPEKFMQRLAALIPPPRQHQVRYHGILAPSATWRDQVVPGPARARPTSPRGHKHYRPWAELLRRVFAVDVLVCPRCGGRCRVVASASEPRTAAALLGLSPIGERGPPAARCSQPTARSPG